MKKSLYLKLQICQESDLQDYVKVCLFTAKLVIFDILSLSFVGFAFKQLFYRLDKNSSFNLLDYRLLVNVSSYGKVIVSLITGKGDVLIDMPLSDLTLAYFRKITKSPFENVDMPDVLVLLSYFLTDKQRSLCGL